MKLLEEYVDDYNHLKREAFLDRHGCPVLLHQLRGLEKSLLSSATVAVPAARGKQVGLERSLLSMSVANTRAQVHLTKVMAKLGEQADADGAVVVFPMQMRRGATELTLGRDSSADIILPFAKISKVHARLASDGQSFRLCDAGSRNGTRLGGQPLAPRAYQALPSESIIHLSEYQFLFYDAAGFYSLLKG